MGKKGFTILIITVIYLCAVSASLLPLFSGNRISDAAIRNRKANIEYMSIHMSGGLSGRTDKAIEVFSEGDKYYLVSTNDAGKIVSTFVNGSVDSEKMDKMLKEYKSIPSHPDSVYYRVQTTDDIVLVEMIDLDTSTFFLTYADKSRRQDIVRIMTGNKTGLAGTIIALAIETVVFAGAVGSVMVIAKKKKSANSPAVKSSSETE